MLDFHWQLHVLILCNKQIKCWQFFFTFSSYSFLYFFTPFIFSISPYFCVINKLFSKQIKSFANTPEFARIVDGVQFVYRVTCCYVLLVRNNSVSIVTRIRNERSGARVPSVDKIFLFSKIFRLILGPNMPPCAMGTGRRGRGGKSAAAWSSLKSIQCRAKNGWSYISRPPVFPHFVKVRPLNLPGGSDIIRSSTKNVKNETLCRPVLTLPLC